MSRIILLRTIIRRRPIGYLPRPVALQGGRGRLIALDGAILLLFVPPVAAASGSGEMSPSLAFRP